MKALLWLVVMVYWTYWLADKIVSLIIYLRDRE
jgi:hypothetical protein